MVVILVTFSTFGEVFALAETTQEGDVLDDLNRDETFDSTLYPSSLSGRDLSLITIAESVDNKLILYVYQPYTENPYFARKVRMSNTFQSANNTGVGVTDYTLKCLSHNGVFYKYLVEGYTVSNIRNRYYNIVQLSRNYIPNVDYQALYDNTIQGVSFEVARQYVFNGYGDNTVITESELEVVTVTDKYCGYVRYPAGFAFMASAACDSHFIAFSTDKQIDKLYEADVTYITQSYEKRDHDGIVHESFGTPSSAQKVTLNSSNMSASYQGTGIAAAHFAWERIENVQAFFDNVDSTAVYTGVLFDVTWGTPLTSEAREAISSKQWVLRFLETPYLYEYYHLDGWQYLTNLSRTLVSAESILRLKCVTNGVAYNLGVVDNYQAEGLNPSNGITHETEFNPKLPLLGTDWEKILRAVLLLVGVVLLAVVVVWVTVKVIGVVKRNKR